MGSEGNLKWVDRINVEAPFIETTGFQLLNLIKPLQSNSSSCSFSPDQTKEIQLLKAIQQDTQLTQVNLEKITIQLSAINQVDLQPLVKELVTGSYDSTEIKKYLSWSLQLALNLLQGVSQNEQINKFYQKVTQGNEYTITPRSLHEKPRSPAYVLTDKSSNNCFALLKQSHPEYFSSFSRHLPEMLVSAPVWERELLGYELDQVLGFDNTPPTLGVLFVNAEQKKVRGTIQEYLPNVRDGSYYYNDIGADLLLAIPRCEMHLVALSGLIKGRSAGHMSNYVLETPADKPELSRIYEIDLEEILLPFNRVSDNEKIEEITLLEKQIAILTQHKEDFTSAIAKLKEEEVATRRSLILGRLWILGLPQSDLPFDRATLLLMANPILTSLIERYHQEAFCYSSLGDASWQALKERVRIIQETAIDELTKAPPHLTPRDLYFKIFGGEHRWSLFQQRGYPDIITFNGMISNPYNFLIDGMEIPLFKKLSENDHSELARFLFKMKNASK